MSDNLTALFHNFTDQPFTGYWDGRPHTFKPGDKVMMSVSLAEHYAKHLTNRVLELRGQISYMSPKKPLEVPIFMEIFNKACIYSDTISADGKVIDVGEAEKDMALHSQPEKADEPVKEEKKEKPVKTKVDKKAPQIIKPPKEDDDDEFENT